MHWNERLDGRKERRLSVVVLVNLAPLEPVIVSPERRERTYTDNISARGARVRSTHAWQLGEQAEISPASAETAETSVRGEVVYCQRHDTDRFVVGLKLWEKRIPWSILKKFNHMQVP